MSTIIDIHEASKLLHVSVSTLRRWSDQGVVNAFRLGSRRDRRFDKDEVLDLLRKDHHIYKARKN